MTTLLLLVIFAAYIGLGIPDSLFGTAWPAIYQDLEAPLSAANGVTLLLTFSTMLSSLASARLINRFGTARVTAASTLLTALALLGFSVSGNLLFLCLFSVPLGFGAGAVDAGLNNYVALHYKASHMSFLHCFYGVGVSISPYLMSVCMAGGSGWRGGYRLAFWLQLSIAVVTVLALPLWRRVDGSRTAYAASGAAQKPRTLSLKAMLATPALPLIWCAFVGSCALECTCGIWGSTFLVEYHGMTVDRAAQMVMFYYMGMALGRFLSGVLAARLSSWRLIALGQGLVLAALVLLLAPLSPSVAGIALFMIGLGNGPVFPNLVHLTPANFGEDVSQSVMGSQMAAAYIGVMIAPPVFGLLAQKIGLFLFQPYLLGMFAVMAAATIFARRALGRRNAGLKTK